MFLNVFVFIPRSSPRAVIPYFLAILNIKLLMLMRSISIVLAVLFTPTSTYHVDMNNYAASFEFVWSCWASSGQYLFQSMGLISTHEIEENTDFNRVSKYLQCSTGISTPFLFQSLMADLVICNSLARSAREIPNSLQMQSTKCFLFS